MDINNDEKMKKVWNKKSIFFQLEYWKHLLLRHNLDVMHIEKNVCDSIIGTLLNIPGKIKDSLASRLYLVEIGVRPESAPQFSKKLTYLLVTCYNLKKKWRMSNM